MRNIMQPSQPTNTRFTIRKRGQEVERKYTQVSRRVAR